MSPAPLTLWESGIGLAKGMARKCTAMVRPFMGDFQQDFEQAALLALWRAALMFRDGCGTEFSSYAYHHIRGELNCERWRQELFGFKAGKAKAYGKILELPQRHNYYRLPDESIPQARQGLLFEDAELLDWLIRQLRPHKAQVVARRFWLEGLTTATIAHQMSLSEDRIAQIRAKAKHDLEALAESMQRMWER